MALIYEAVMTSAEIANDHERWLAERKKGIGGSDAASVIGLNKWTSAYTLWTHKTGKVEPEDISDKEVVYWGTILEDVVAKEFEKQTGKKVRRQGMIRNLEYPFMLADVDRVVVGENAIVECKTASSFKKDEWLDDNIPDSYYVQVQHYMMVGGYEKCYICCLLGGNHFIMKEVLRNEDDIAALREAEINFWNVNVLQDVMPEVDGSESTKETLSEQYESSNGMAIALPAAANDLIIRRDQLVATQEAIKQEMETIDNNLRAMLGENKQGEINGRKVTWADQKGRTTIDSKGLMAAYPEIYQQFAKVGKPSRRFSVK